MEPSIMSGTFSNIDSIMGIYFYNKIYSNSRIIFGAFPSMHFGLAYAFFETELSCDYFNIFALFYTFWMFWAAIYSNHHYFTDIIFAAIIVKFIKIIYCIINKTNLRSIKQNNFKIII